MSTGSSTEIIKVTKTDSLVIEMDGIVHETDGAQESLFDEDFAIPDTVILDDGIILEGSNASYGAAFMPRNYEKLLEAEVFLGRYAEVGSVDIRLLDGSMRMIAVHFAGEQSQAYFVEKHIQSIASSALQRYWATYGENNFNRDNELTPAP